MKIEELLRLQNNNFVDETSNLNDKVYCRSA